jgi:O-antigen/teichoic acid export membrane protein
LIIGYIGVERYGVWAIVGVITSYCGLLDLGFGTSFVKFIAAAAAGNETRTIGTIVTTGLLLYLALGLCLSLGAVFFADQAVRIVRIPPELSAEASRVVVLGVIAFSLSMIASVPAAVQTGLQRMDIANGLSFAMSALNIVGTVYVLKAGFGLQGLMTVAVLIAGVTCCLNALVAVHLVGAANFMHWGIDRHLLRLQMRYGAQLQVSRIANLISFQADRLIISFFLGIGPVAFYQIGASLLQQARQLPLLLISALVPAVSELDRRNNTARIRELYVRGSRYLIGSSVPLTVFIAAAAPDIIFVWMGLGFSLSASVIRILAVGYCAATVTGVASSIAAGTGRTDIDMKFGLVMAALNIVVSVTLVRVMGFSGVIVGNSLSLTIASCLFVRMFHKQVIALPVSAFYRLCVKPCVSAVGALAACWLIDLVWRHDASSGRVVLLWILGVKAGFFCVVYAALMQRQGYFDAYDRGLVKGGLRVLFRYGT